MAENTELCNSQAEAMAMLWLSPNPLKHKIMKFEFYQDKEIRSWVRDYFTVEADSIEEAILLIKNGNEDLEDLECDFPEIEFTYRDDNSFFVDMEDGIRAAIYRADNDEEIWTRDNR